MTTQEWEKFAFTTMTIPCAGKLKLHLGKLLGSGGAGAVYDLISPSGFVIKLLEPESPIAKQEQKSIDIISSNARFAIGIQKQIPSRGIVQFENQSFFCYMMRKGKSLKQALEDKDSWLTMRKRDEIQRMMAHLIHGLCSLKNMGVCHGDIKADNILLFEYNNQFYPTLADYGTISDKRLSIKTIQYDCRKSECGSSLEEGIAYDLHCLYLVFCEIYNIDDDDISSIPNPDIKRVLRIMRDEGTKAFVRLNKLMTALKDMITIPPGFYLDSIMKEDFERFNNQFEKFMQWQEYHIWRDKFAINDFDPLVLLPVSAERYDNAYTVICTLDRMDSFIMPIVRYHDQDNQYVLVHAPDDENIASKRSCWREDDYCRLRIKDEKGLPYTLDQASISTQKKEMEKFIQILSKDKINIEFSPKNIWHVDGRWKLNLFTVKFLGSAEKEAEICSILWEK